MPDLMTRINKSLHRKATRRVLRAGPASLPGVFERSQHRFADGPDSIDYDTASGLFCLREAEITLHVARQSRLRYHLNGMHNRQRALLAEYLVADDLIRPGDHVLDCGANIGEFSMALRAAGATCTAFEPDPIELKALTVNAVAAGQITVMNMALWHADEELEFFDANETGDSSLFDPGRSTRSYKVMARKLDTLRADGQIPDRIRLLKLEAEGAEPEILSGATETLRHVDYVTVDMGPERGLEKSNTVAEVVTTLTRAGFELIRFETRRIVGLFAAKRLGGG